MKKRKLNLQLFAGEGDAGTAANTPAGTTAEAGSQLATGSEAGSQLATGTETMSFDDFLKSNPNYAKEYQTRMQNAVKGRIKDTKRLEGQMEMINPVLALFGQKYGIDTSNLSDEALKELTGKILGDNSFYEEEAMKAGMDVETYKTFRQTQRENAQLKEFQEKTMRNQENQKRLYAIQEEAKRVKEIYPGFDLDTEMSNPMFQRLAWDSGVPLQTAYEVIHQQEIMAAAMQMTTRKTTEMIANNIQAGTYRPTESGVSGQSAALVQTGGRMTKEQREDIKNRVRNGERVVL